MFETDPMLWLDLHTRPDLHWTGSVADPLCDLWFRAGKMT